MVIVFCFLQELHLNLTFLVTFIRCPVLGLIMCSTTVFTPFPRLHTFSVGMEGSSYLPKAKMVADFLGAFYNCLVLVVLTTF